MKLHFDKKYYKALLFAGVGSILFIIAYSSTTLLLVNTFHANACNTSILSVKEAMLLTSPINYCEATSHMYKNILGGLFSNAWVVSVLVLLAIFYSTCVGDKFKKYLCFRDAFIVAIVSTYILSLGDFLAGGAGGGTSIIGFDMLFYLLLAFGFGLITLIKEKGFARTSMLLLYFGYVVPIVLILSFMVAAYLAIPNPWPHIEGGILLLAYLFIRVGILEYLGAKPDRNKK